MVTEDLEKRSRSVITHVVDKKVAHKNHEENVFVSHIEKVSDMQFEVKGLLPKNHFTHNDHLSGLNACPYFIELSRQANMAICHLFFDIKLNASFTMTLLDWEFTRNQPFLARSFDPIAYHVEFVRCKTRKNITFIKTQSNLYQNNFNFLTGLSSFFISHTGSDEIKNNSNGSSFLQKPDPIAPEFVQVRKTENALITHPAYDITTQAFKTQMIVDTGHPYFYEHPRDHIPGMMLFEAGKQAIIGVLKLKHDFLKNAYGDIKKGTVVFSKFASAQSEVTMDVIAQDPVDYGNHVHIPVSVLYFQDGEQLGTFESVATFMDKKEALLKSIYIPVT